MKIAAIQVGIKREESRRDRFGTVCRALEELRREDAPDLILLPELWGCGFNNFMDYEASSEEFQGETCRLLGEWARACGSMIHAGSIVERDRGRYYNTSILLGRRGEVLAGYRKIHLFGFQSEEQRRLVPGSRAVTVETEFGRMGLATCYDLRFPEQFRRMAEQGAEIFLVTAAWPAQRLSHWRLFNQVRALENQAFLLACNCAFEREGSQFAGHSMFVRPTGEVLAEAGEEAQVLRCEIRVEEARNYREAFPALQDRVRFE